MNKLAAILSQTFRKKSIPNFSRGKYEIALAMFSLFAFFFLREDSSFVYPHILLVLAFFLGFNLFFNLYIKEKSEIDLRFYFTVNLINCLIIFLILMFSGGKLSYLWFLLLLPVMAVALSGENIYTYILVFLSFSSMAYFYVFNFQDEFSEYFSLTFKGMVIAVSAAFIKNNAQARKALEAELSFKRKQAEMLFEEVSKGRGAADGEKLKSDSIDIEKSDFTAVAIHDLKNLISVIYVISQILQRDENAQKKEVDKLVSASKMAARLSKYALSSSRKEYSFTPQKLDLGLLSKETLELLEYKLVSKGIKAKNLLPEGVFFCMLDRFSFQRSLTNLILNSFLVLPQGGNITLDASMEGGKIKFIIFDDGPGFPAQILDGIKPYNTGRIKEGGTGLGLYSVLKEISKNGGEFRIYNLASGGACCEILLEPCS